VDRFDNMRVFAKVAEVGSFTGAAARLGMSASMVSQHVKELEERLSARLLNRTTRKVSLTEIGRAYWERCARLLADLEETEQAVSDMHAAPRGELRVYAATGFGILQLTPAIADFTARFPAISVELIVSERFVDPIEEGFDVAVWLGELPDSSLITRQLAPCRLVVCGAPSYFEKYGTPRTLADLAAHNCFAFSGNGSSYFRSWHLTAADGTTTNIVPAGNLRTNSAAVLKFAALSGHGVACLPTYLVCDALRSGQLVTVLEDYVAAPLMLRALYPHNRHLSAKVRAFVDFLVARFGHEPPWDAWCQAGSEQPAVAPVAYPPVPPPHVPNADRRALVGVAEGS
jgi:DNA-binding transcriptional LysR family regulator